MAERLQRTQILLEPEQHQALTAIARQEGRSLSEVVRQMVQDQLAQRHRIASAVTRRRLDALDRIERHREAVLAHGGGEPLPVDVPELLRHLREERDERNLGLHRDRG